MVRKMTGRDGIGTLSRVPVALVNPSVRRQIGIRELGDVATL
jgi:hypothetical protein